MGSLVQAGNNSLLSRLDWKYGQTASRDFHTCMWRRCEAGLTHRSSCRMCVCACVCLKLSEIDHAIPFVRISPYTPCAIAGLFPHLVKTWLCRHLIRSHWGTSCSPAAPQPRQPVQHSQSSATGTSCAAGHRWKHPNTVCSVAQTPLPPPSAEVKRRAQRKSTYSQTDQAPRCWLWK